MNASFTVDVSGLEKKLAMVESGPILEAAIVAGMEVVRDEWKGLFRPSNAPATPGSPPRVQTGAYRDSITVVEGASGDGYAEASVGTVGLEPRYDIYLEYGTAKMPAHPFFRPGVEAARSSVVSHMTSEIEKVIAT